MTISGIARFDWNKPCDYDEAQKTAFHTEARHQLVMLARELGLPRGSYEIRSNKGGIAVSGEIILHHETLYLQVSQSSFGGGILYRSCKGRKDFCGGVNHFADLALLDDPSRLARLLSPFVNAPDAPS